MCIPRIIHYCWFGKNPLPEKVKKCIESWKKYCPEYQILLWNEDNYDLNKLPYVKQAYGAGMWAYVTDYVRLDVVWQHGGIYLDTDVELVRSLDDLLKEDNFFAIEKHTCTIATGLGFGAVKKSPVLRELMDMYQNLSFIKDGKMNLTPCPEYMAGFFREKGYIMEDKIQRTGGILVLSSEYFCPMNFLTGDLQLTSRTYGIHWYDASWHSECENRIIKTERRIRKKFPAFAANLLCYAYRQAVLFIEYSRKGILKEKLKEKFGRKR